MQVKIYHIPAIGGEAVLDEMNLFLRTKKILQVEKHFFASPHAMAWNFCVSYLDELPATTPQGKIDYRQALDEPTFKRFSRLREIRKQIAASDGIPAYAVFTDEELSNLAKIEDLTLAKMKKIHGIGEKKVAKYGLQFVTEAEATNPAKEPDEKS